MKYLKSLTTKFLTSLSRLEFINCMLSMNTKSLPKKNAMYFSSPFGIASTFKLNLCSSEKIK